MDDTKNRILDAAERLFAERGFAGTSLRALTQEAAVNLAAVSYHFGSKQNLFKAVVDRRLRPVNEERLQRLSACLKNTPTVEAVLRAFIEPSFSLAPKSPAKRDTFMRLVGRLYAEPLEEIFDHCARQFEEVLLRFMEALSRLLPQLTAEEILWRLHFVIGSLLHPFMVGSRITRYTKGLCTFEDTRALSERMVRFAVAGMQAPPASHD